jgi:biopolymer transport protein TolQ
LYNPKFGKNQGEFVVNHSFLDYFLGADVVVKTVMAILLLASVLSWTIIFQRGLFLKNIKHSIVKFEDKFWAGTSLSALYTNLNAYKGSFSALENIFHAGFKEFTRLRQLGFKPDVVMEGVLRSMGIAKYREMDKLEHNLSTLATIGSVTPYIGLLGTVWGIMAAFQALGSVQQATVAMVAPGISEALVATAMGLFAAIPAVIAYNRFSNSVDFIVSQYDIFQEELSNILYRQVYSVASNMAAVTE